MQARSILAITALACGLSAGLAQAQPQDRGDRGGPSRDARAPERQGGPRDMRDHRQMAARPMPDHGRGAGPDQRYRRGDRLPPDQRGRQYVIDDWRNHRLSAPPRGQHWVQIGADYALVAIATGVIAQIILGH